MAGSDYGVSVIVNWPLNMYLQCTINGVCTSIWFKTLP